MQTAHHAVSSTPAAERPRLRVVRDRDVSILSHLRPRRPATLALGELLADYRAHVVATERRSPSAVATLDTSLGHLDELRDLRAVDITVEICLALIDAHAAQGLSGSTTRKVLSVLSESFEFSWTVGANLANPVRQIPRSELPSTQPRDRLRAQLEVLELADVRRVLDDRKVLRFDERLLFGVLLLSGMRIGEAAGLQWGDVALHVGPLHGQLKIERSWDCKRQVYASTKAGEPRLVPVMAQLRALLDEARAWFQRRWRRDPIAGEVLCRYMPPRQGGEWRLWNEQTAIRTWRRALPALGIPHPLSGARRLHATRHTFVTQALRADAQERALEPVTHTVRHGAARARAFDLYAHVNWADSCRAVAKIQDALASAT